jgi:hypothetical protein
VEAQEAAQRRQQQEEAQRVAQRVEAQRLEALRVKAQQEEEAAQRWRSRRH